MLKIAVIGGVLLVGIIVLVMVIGYALPKQHVAARAIVLRQKPGDVFALISNFKDGASWRAGLEHVELLPERDGHIRFRERGKNGALRFEVVEFNPPQRMVTQIESAGMPFGGVWIFEIAPAPEGSRLNITERGEIYNPVFRFISRFVLGYTGTLDTYLNGVARKFGENSAPVEGEMAER
jgi:hypothetical protein